MSKFLKIMIVLLTVAAVATPVIAADNLGLSGQMRVRASYLDDGGDDTTSWLDQRLRIGGNLSVAEGVSVTFRFDTTEGQWGTGNDYGTGRATYAADATEHDKTIHFDRAHIDLAFSSFSLRAGQQYIGVGAQDGTFNAQDHGFRIATNGDVPVTAFVMLADANAASHDGFYYGGNVGFGADAFKGNAFFASQNSVSNLDEEIYLIGADVTFNMDAIKILAELDFFTGDASATTDAFGTQLFVDASMSADAMTFGGQIWYAMGDDEDTQFAVLGNDFNGYDPLYAVGSGLDNGPFGATRPQTFFGSNAGVMAARVYTSAKASDALNIGASVAYLQPEEDDNVAADSALAIAVGMNYAVMANTSLGALVEYTDVDEADDEVIAASVGLFVNF